jgi:hypothetical protein
MDQVSAALLAQACRVFMRLAYPGGPETVPSRKRVYYDLPTDRSAADFLPPAAAPEICQAISTPGNGVVGYALRLGSAGFPHLKLKMQRMGDIWVFMVDTHDSFSRDSMQPPATHPDAPAWLALQAANRDLKEKIEQALEREGMATFNSLLREDLKKCST